MDASFGAVLRVDATKACCLISCSFCRLAEDPLEGGVSAPPVPKAADFCPLGVSVIFESCIGVWLSLLVSRLPFPTVSTETGGLETATGGPVDSFLASFSSFGSFGGSDLLSMLSVFDFSGEEACDFGDLVLIVGKRLSVPGLTGAGRFALLFLMALTFVDLLAGGAAGRAPGGGPGGRRGGADLARGGPAVGAALVSAAEVLVAPVKLLLAALVGDLERDRTGGGGFAFAAVAFWLEGNSRRLPTAGVGGMAAAFCGVFGGTFGFADFCFELGN